MITHNLRHLGMGLALLLAQNIHSQETFHVYMNNGKCESFIYDEVDSITFSCDDDAEMRQHIWIRGKAISYDVSQIDHTDFVTPPTTPLLVVGRNPQVTKRNAILQAELVGAEPGREYYMGIFVQDRAYNRHIYYYPENRMTETVETDRDDIIGITDKGKGLLQVMKKGSRYRFNFDYTYFSFNYILSSTFSEREFIYQLSMVDDQNKYLQGNFYVAQEDYEASKYDYMFRFLPDEPSEAEYVDLGQGVLWQTKNLGAKSITDPGEKYAWAMLNPSDFAYPKDYPYLDWYDANTYQFRQFDDISGSESYDAARHALGDGWRIPTVREWEYLFRKCWRQYHVHNGVKGVLITAPDGMNQMFVPHDNLDPDYSCLWTSTPADTRDYLGWTRAYCVTSKTSYEHYVEGGIYESSKHVGNHIRAVKTK